MIDDMTTSIKIEGADKTRKNDVCFICMRSTIKSSINIFDEDIKTIQKFSLPAVLSDIISETVDRQSVNSDVLCKHCFKLCAEFQNFLGCANNIKHILLKKYNLTLKSRNIKNSRTIIDIVKQQQQSIAQTNEYCDPLKLVQQIFIGEPNDQHVTLQQYDPSNQTMPIIKIEQQQQQQQQQQQLINLTNHQDTTDILDINLPRTYQEIIMNDSNIVYVKNIPKNSYIKQQHFDNSKSLNTDASTVLTTSSLSSPVNAIQQLNSDYMSTNNETITIVNANDIVGTISYNHGDIVNLNNANNIDINETDDGIDTQNIILEESTVEFIDEDNLEEYFDEENMIEISTIDEQQSVEEDDVQMTSNDIYITNNESNNEDQENDIQPYGILLEQDDNELNDRKTFLLPEFEVNVQTTTLEKNHEAQDIISNILNAATTEKTTQTPNQSTETSSLPPVSLESIFTRDGTKFTCRICTDNIVYDTRTISIHVKTVHSLRIYICDLCGKDFGKRGELCDHLDEHIKTNELNEFKCESCDATFDSLRLFRVHKRVHFLNTKAWLCTECNRKFSSMNLLEEHMNMHTGERPYKCPHCAKDFASKYTLTAHMKIHSDRDRPFKCKECEKSFFSNQNLTQHERTHTGIKKFVCDQCNKAFGTAHNLEVHKIVHSGYKPFICRTCNKAFARRAEIKDHERTHTGERPYSCDLCGLSFAQRSNLMTHKRATHLNDKRYKCETCDRSFKRRRLLDYHIKAAHTMERPYSCESCYATFVYPEHYKKHLRIHTGWKPYLCEICGKAFNSRDNRNAHRFVHSDKKPYECIICSQGFMRKPLLMAHMRNRNHINDTIIVNQPILTTNNGIILKTRTNDSAKIMYTSTITSVNLKDFNEAVEENDVDDVGVSEGGEEDDNEDDDDVDDDDENYIEEHIDEGMTEEQLEIDGQVNDMNTQEYTECTVLEENGNYFISDSNSYIEDMSLVANIKKEPVN